MGHRKLAPQEKEDYCVCSILQGILARHGITYSQESIASALTLTKSNNGYVIDDTRIKSFLENKGFDYSFYWHNQTPFNEPDILLEEIAANDGFIGLGMEGIGLHGYRVLRFKHPIITADDPKDSSLIEFNLYNLRNEMARLDGGFGLLKKI